MCAGKIGSLTLFAAYRDDCYKAGNEHYGPGQHWGETAGVPILSQTSLNYPIARRKQIP